MTKREDSKVRADTHLGLRLRQHLIPHPPILPGLDPSHSPNPTPRIRPCPTPPAAIPRLESGPPRRWLKADMPAAVPLGTDVSLLVRITTSASSGGGGTVLLKAFKIGADETRVAVIVQAPRGIAPTEPLEQLLVVPADGDSTPVRFAFRAERPGLFTIRVTAFVGGTFLGEFTAELSVEAGGRLTEGPTRIAAIAPVQPEAGGGKPHVPFV